MKSECELAAAVISWLKEKNYTVYEEVKDIDIVAVKGDILWAIEVKNIVVFNFISASLGSL